MDNDDDDAFKFELLDHEGKLTERERLVTRKWFAERKRAHKLEEKVKLQERLLKQTELRGQIALCAATLLAAWGSDHFEAALERARNLVLNALP